MIIGRYKRKYTHISKYRLDRWVRAEITLTNTEIGGRNSKMKEWGVLQILSNLTKLSKTTISELWKYRCYKVSSGKKLNQSTNSNSNKTREGGVVGVGKSPRLLYYLRCPVFNKEFTRHAKKQEIVIHSQEKGRKQKLSEWAQMWD